MDHEPDAAPEQPPEDAPLEELDSERVLGTSPAGRAASGFMVALNRAARSFLLYDPTNEAIRHFLEALRKASDECFLVHGDLELKVRPFELALGAEVVYLDTDRERSLSFRLYRDGVRRVVIQSQVTWHEILKFLEVVSVRFTGVRQTEDDMVVLLWKAGFQNIQVEAVEGVIEDDGAEALMAQASTGHYASAPDDFDLPAPVLLEEREVLYQPIPQGVLEWLAQEDGSTALPSLCVRLAEALMDGVVRPHSPLSMDDIVPLLRELRDFLLAEGTLEPLIALVRCLLAAPLTAPGDISLRDDIAASFLDVRGMGRLLRSVPRDQPTAPPEMIALLEEVPGDHLPALFATQASERSEHVRRVARQLIEYYVPSRVDWMLAQLNSIDDYPAGQLSRAIAQVHPDRAIDVVGRIADRSDPDLQLEALHILEHAALNPTGIRLLTRYLSAEHEVVRLRALAVAARRKVRAAFPLVVERVKRETLRLSEAEADACGMAMAATDQARAMDQFREWTTPAKFFQFVPPGQKALHWVAVSGLADIPGEEAEKLIQNVVKQAEKLAQIELGKHCVAAMVKRRRAARGSLA